MHFRGLNLPVGWLGFGEPKPSNQQLRFTERAYWNQVDDPVFPVESITRRAKRPHEAMRLLVVDEEIIPGGVETLRLNLLPELARICESVVWVLPGHEVEVFRRRMRDERNFMIESLNWPRGSLPQLLDAVLRRVSRLLPRRLVHRLTRTLLEARLRAIVRIHRCTRCLTTCVFNQPIPMIGLPTAGFVCDVNPAISDPTRQNIVHWVRGADAVLGISEFTCAELRSLAPACAHKIHPVPLAAPPSSRRTHPPESQWDFYFPAAPNVHKGHRILFEACLLLAGRGFDFRLALSGSGTEGFREGGTFMNAEMEDTRRFFQEHSAELGTRVTILGEVGHHELATVFANARSVVLPSLYEGFGFPLVEALRHGNEIICTELPPYREQLVLYGATDRARIVPPGDPGLLADAMEQLLRCAPLGRPDPEEVDCRMARWTWADVARRCLDHLAALPDAR